MLVSTGVAAMIRGVSSVLLFSAALLTTGCTREINIGVSIVDKKVHLSLSQPNGLFGPKRRGACVTALEIFDTDTHEKAWSVRASEADCRKVVSIMVGSVPPGFRPLAADAQIVSGRRYYASAVAEQGVGRSYSWIAP
jgi:hypothetical protein